MRYSVELEWCVANIKRDVITSTAVMIAIIIGLKGGSPLSIDDIGAFAIHHFPLWISRIASQVSGVAAVSPHLHLDLLTTLRSYDFEFFRDDVRIRPTSLATEIRFSLSERAARWILRDYLYPLRATCAPHPNDPRQLDTLPEEVKAQIFEYVLVLPKSGVKVDVDFTRTQGLRRDGDAKRQVPKALQLLSRNDTTSHDLSNWWATSSGPVTDPKGTGARTFTMPLPPQLDLLRVNRRTMQICLPIFYGKNHFHAANLQEWHTLLSTLAPSRKALLRHVSLSLRPQDTFRAATVFNTLNDIGVESVGIYVSNFDWTGYDNSGPVRIRWLRRKRDDELISIRGIDALLGMGSGVTMRVEGSWKEFAEFVRDHSEVGEVTYQGNVVHRVGEVNEDGKVVWKEDRVKGVPWMKT